MKNIIKSICFLTILIYIGYEAKAQTIIPASSTAPEMIVSTGPSYPISLGKLRHISNTSLINVITDPSLPTTLPCNYYVQAFCNFAATGNQNGFEVVYRNISNTVTYYQLVHSLPYNFIDIEVNLLKNNSTTGKHKLLVSYYNTLDQKYQYRVYNILGASATLISSGNIYDGIVNPSFTRIRTTCVDNKRGVIVMQSNNEIMVRTFDTDIAGTPVLGNNVLRLNGIYGSNPDVAIDKFNRVYVGYINIANNRIHVSKYVFSYLNGTFGSFGTLINIPLNIDYVTINNFMTYFSYYPSGWIPLSGYLTEKAEISLRNLSIACPYSNGEDQYTIIANSNENKLFQISKTLSGVSEKFINNDFTSPTQYFSTSTTTYVDGGGLIFSLFSTYGTSSSFHLAKVLKYENTSLTDYKSLTNLGYQRFGLITVDNAQENESKGKFVTYTAWSPSGSQAIFYKFIPISSLVGPSSYLTPLRPTVENVDIAIYPNPIVDKININGIGLEDDIEFILTDINGKVVIHQIGKFDQVLKHINSNIYLLKNNQNFLVRINNISNGNTFSKLILKK